MLNRLSNTGRRAVALLALLTLAACATPGVGPMDGPVTRNIAATGELDHVPQAGTLGPSFRVEAIDVVVPRSLKVSERNSFYPGGDIVWREDPIGDRHEQVKAIMQAGLAAGAQSQDGARAVTLDVVVTRFHALTEKARYTVGGVHAIQFDLTVRDAATGEVIRPTKRIIADFAGLGGSAAIAAEQQGITQKLRITEQLARVIDEELSTQDGYRAQSTGVFGLINRL